MKKPKSLNLLNKTLMIILRKWIERDPPYCDLFSSKVKVTIYSYIPTESCSITSKVGRYIPTYFEKQKFKVINLYD